MEVSEGLLVALMFITIVTMAIAALLASLVDLVNVAPTASYSRLQTVWIGFLLLSLLDMFWHTIDLLEVEEWGFPGFLYVIAGAILSFLAASVLTTSEEQPDDASGRAGYARIVGRFLVLFALLQAWVVGVDFVLARGFVPGTTINVALGVLALALLGSDAYRVHLGGAIVAWVLTLSAFGLRGFAVI